MKRRVMLMATLLVAIAAHAQTLDSIAHHQMGPYSAQTSTFMEMPDGSLLGGILVASENQPYFASLGYTMHKVSRLESQLAITDTLFIPYDFLPWHMTAKNPSGEGNILAEYFNDNDNGGCAMKIRQFDNDLRLDTTETIVRLSSFFGHSTDPFIEPNGDIVFAYYDYSVATPTYHFTRVGLDGTIKLQASYDSLLIYSLEKKFLRPFSESPLRYCFCGIYRKMIKEPKPYIPYVYCYLMDSLFNVTDLYVLPSQSNYHETGPVVNYSNRAYETRLLGLDDGNFLVARPYNRPSMAVPYIEDDGIAVTKYDSDFNLLAQRKFLSEPYVQLSEWAARPIGMERSRDGYVYFAYFTHEMFKPSQVSVVKMDSDLNIIWQRHCLEREVGRNWGSMVVLEDNSVAVMGINTILTETGFVDHTEAFYIVVHDDYDALEEQGIIVRPYAYWPNPAQDELRLQYSPDVTPTQIELHDLQGRLVRSQRNGLESLNLQGMPSGTYTMRVTLAGGKVFSDKVVKE